MNIAVILVLIATFLGAFGTLFLKKGAHKITRDLKVMLKNYELMLGIIFYVLASVLFLIALKSENLSLLYPINSLAYVWVSLLSIKYLGEKMNKYKWLGTLLIILGVVLVTQ